MMLEAAQHSSNAYITLTYATPSLTYVHPEYFLNYGPLRLATLVPKDAQDWLKRLRKLIYPLKIRFFLVGEYGDQMERPHYHAIIFGLEPCARGKTVRIRMTNTPDPMNCCAACRSLQETWPLGLIESQQVAEPAMRYVAGYTIKKMTNPDDFRLNGRYPEFTRQSNRPGLGYDAMFEVASVFMSHKKYERSADVPAALQHGKKILPLGRYLRRALRVMVGRDANAPRETIDEMAIQLQPMLEAAEAAQKGSGRTRSAIFKDLLFEAGKTQSLSQEKREHIFRQKRKL